MKLNDEAAMWGGVAERALTPDEQRSKDYHDAVYEKFWRPEIEALAGSLGRMMKRPPLPAEDAFAYKPPA